MKIVFRCDSSNSIGTGHVTRCLNLAQILGGEITFLCRDLPGNISSKIVQNQMDLIELPEIPNHSIGKKIEEVELLAPLLQTIRPDIIIVDHYGLDETWESEARKWCSKLVAIDDLGRSHHSAVILDQNLRAQTPPNYLVSNPRLFLGPRYAILNQEFHSIGSRKPITEKAREMLVFFGGIDQPGLTLVLAEIALKSFPHLHWKFVLGSGNKQLEQVRGTLANRPNFEIIVNTGHMASLMLGADLFIGAGGTTTWERTKTGLPSIVISIAENQEEGCRTLHEAGIIHYLGKFENVDREQIRKTIQAISNDQKLRQSFSSKSLQLETGAGIWEFCLEIQQS